MQHRLLREIQETGGRVTFEYLLPGGRKHKVTVRDSIMGRLFADRVGAALAGRENATNVGRESRRRNTA